MLLDVQVFKNFVKQYKKGDLIFLEYEKGDTFYFINSGKIRVTKIINKSEESLDILGEGEFFGEMAILEDAPRSASAFAEEDCVLLEFNRQNFDAIVAGNPQIAFMLLKVLTKRIYTQKRKISILTHTDNTIKLMDVFLMLHETKAVPINFLTNKDKVEFVVTAQDLSSWCGLGVAEVQEILKVLHKARKIELHSQSIIINNLNDFKRSVSLKRDTL